MIFLSFVPRGNQTSVPQVRYLETYKHDTRAIGGYRSAQFSFFASIGEVTLWTSSGLGTRVTAKNEFGQTVWEGFVNHITISTSEASRSIGPLTETSNRVACTYSTPDYAGLEKSVQATTDYTQDDGAISRYGYFTEVFSGGTKRPSVAITARDRHLSLNAYPTVIDTAGATQGPASTTTYRINVDCAGYTRYLERSVYNYTADEKDQDIREKLALIFERTNFEQSVGGFSTSIGASGNVAGWEDRGRSGWEAINDAIEELGYTYAKCGMFENSVFVFSPVSETGGDVYTRDSVTGRMSVSGVNVLNSAVMPGTFVLSSIGDEGAPYFIESVSYDMSSDTIKTNHAKRNIQAVLRRVYGAF